MYKFQRAHKYSRLTREIVEAALKRGEKPKNIAQRMNINPKALYGIIYRYRLGIKHYAMEG